MTPVFPYLIRRSQDGWRGELLLRLRSGKAAYVVHLSMEQARMLAVEMRGLASDHCPLHHMAVRLTEALNAKISHVIIKRVGPADEVAGMVRMVTTTELRTTQVDAAAALSLAIHMGLPIFMDGEFSVAEPEPEGNQGGSLESDANAPGEAEQYQEIPAPIPKVFQDLIDGLEMPDGNESHDA